MFSSNLVLNEVKIPAKDDPTKSYILWPNNAAQTKGVPLDGDSGAAVKYQGKIIGVLSYYHQTIDFSENANKVSTVYSVVDNDWYKANIDVGYNINDFIPQSAKGKRAFVIYGRQRRFMNIEHANGVVETGQCKEFELNYPEVKTELANARANNVEASCISTLTFKPGEKAVLTEGNFWKNKWNYPRYPILIN